MLTLYLYPRCTTCQKAQKWLNERGVSYSMIDIKKDHPDAETIERIQEKCGFPLKRLFNTSGMLYRQLNLSEKLKNMSESDQLDLLGSDGMLVKRPLLIGEDFALVGFREKEWEAKLNA